jgi:hypothetical protein
MPKPLASIFFQLDQLGNSNATPRWSQGMTLVAGKSLTKASATPRGRE